MSTPEKRKKVTAFIVSTLKELLPNGDNAKRIQALLDGLSDEQFGDYMKKIGKGIKGEDCLRIIVPNFGKEKIDIECSKKVAKKLGLEMFQPLVMGSDDPDTPTFVTPNKYLVGYLPVRRQAQFSIEGVSVAEHHQTVDQRTGAPTRDSAAAKVSYPELNILMAMGMDKTAVELMKFRGGDIGGFDAMNTVAAREGEVSMASIEQHATGVQVVKTVSDMLTSMHLVNSLSPK